MSKKSMMLVKSSWQDDQTFKMIPIEESCPYVECIYDPQSKVFVINFMPFELKKQVLFCGRTSGEAIDKFKETGLIKEEAETIDCPRIKQAAGCLECEVVNEIDAGDHVIIIGEVLKSIKKKESKKIFQKHGDVFTTTQ